MKDIVREIELLQLEVEEFIEDMDTVQSRFAVKMASLDEYYNTDKVLKKARSILVRYEALKTELEAELEGVEDPFFLKQLQDLIESITAMKAQVSSLSKTLSAMGKGLVPKTLEQYARSIRKTVKSYFANPKIVTHSKKSNAVRTDLSGTNGKKFFQTVVSIKGYKYPVIVVEPLDGNYTKDMPKSGNVHYRGKDISVLEQWVKTNFRGKGLLSPALDPFEHIWEGALVELKTEIKGMGQDIGANYSQPSKPYHFKKGTILKYARMRSRGDFFLKVVKLNAGVTNQFEIGELINTHSFGLGSVLKGTSRVR